MLEYIAQGLLEKSERAVTKARSGPGGMAMLPEESEDSDSDASGVKRSDEEDDNSDCSEGGGFGGRGQGGTRSSFVERLRRATASIDTTADGNEASDRFHKGSQEEGNTCPFLPRPRRRRTIRLIPVLRFDDLLWSMNNYERSSRM